MESGTEDPPMNCQMGKDPHPSDPAPAPGNIVDRRSIAPENAEQVKGEETHNPRLSTIATVESKSIATPISSALDQLTEIQSTSTTIGPATIPPLTQQWTLISPPQGHEPREDGVIDVEIPPVDEQRPGILISPHLIPLQDPTLGPGEASYFAFGAAIATGKQGNSSTVQKGQAYIRLYGSNCNGAKGLPEAPSDEQAREARIYTLGLNEGLDKVTRRPPNIPAYPNPESGPGYAIPLNPAVPEFVPGSRYSGKKVNATTLHSRPKNPRNLKKIPVRLGRESRLTRRSA